MKSSFLVNLAVSLVTVFSLGCGGHDSARPIFVSQIQSDPNFDGDIALVAPLTFTITSALATGSVRAGIDPVSGDEFRGFLDFPLAGPGGVPATAAIVSASLDIFIAGVTVVAPANTLPLLIDLVSFQPPTLIPDDFDRPPLASTAFDVFTSDTGGILVVDVTPLMIETQRLGLPDFQLRLLLDFIASSGLIEIDDSIAATAPLLTVEFI